MAEAKIIEPDIKFKVKVKVPRGDNPQYDGSDDLEADVRGWSPGGIDPETAWNRTKVALSFRGQEIELSLREIKLAIKLIEKELGMRWHVIR